MEKIFLALLLFILPSLAWSQSAPVAEVARAMDVSNTNEKILNQITANNDSVFIKRIVISGFVLSDKKPLMDIIKFNQKKYLSQEQIEKIVDDIKVLYLEAGYAGLVDVNYTIEKTDLKITVLLLSR